MKNVVCKQMKYQWVSVVMILVAFGLAGCTKGVDPDPNEKFAGTWHMSGTCFSGTTNTGNLFFGKGSDKNTITYSFTADGSNGSNNDCMQPKTITGTVDGDKATFAETTLTDGCGTSYKVNAVATIKDGVLTFTFNTSRFIDESCTATGTRTNPL